MEWIIIILYSLSLLLIFLFSLGQLNLTWHYLQAKKSTASEPARREITAFPTVTVQLPIFNEKYVVERLIDAVCRLDYPRDKLEIQVLDDSTDETRAIVEARVKWWRQRGVMIDHITRSDRVGYKAGALKHGMERCKGEFIAIFDADFLPAADFLKTTLPHFAEDVGMVQTRWGHLNKNYSMLTKLQAFGLDAHFSIEQKGRNRAGSFINFNGTGGVWRKACIVDAGGWSADTLTEDLDLSYRAQLSGWQFKYLEECVAPAELPVIMSAVKSQQYRWNKGGAQTARKNLAKVLRSSLSPGNKLHAVLHLLNSSVFVCLLLASLLSVPMLFVKEAHPELQLLFDLGSVFLIGFFSIAIFYWVAVRQQHAQNPVKHFISVFPVFLAVSMGLSLHNGLAVLEGLFGIKSAFIRTPKFNITGKGGAWKHNAYIKRKIDASALAEGLLSLYFIFGIAAGIYLHDWGLMLFHAMLATGFASVFLQSVSTVTYAGSQP